MSHPSESDQTSPQKSSDGSSQQQTDSTSQNQQQQQPNQNKQEPTPESQSESDQNSKQQSDQNPQLTPEQEEELEKLQAAIKKATEKFLDLELAKVKAAVLTQDPQAVAMSLSVLLALTICPAMLGSQEAIRQSQSKSRREEHRARRCNLVVSCVRRSIRSRDINNKLVVLRDNKLYISNELETEYTEDIPGEDGYPFAGYFLPYPDSSHEGLVSTIMDDPPMLNWIYVDKETFEVKYGVRADAQPNITGPFDCTKQDRRMIMEGWEGFCAVEETPGVWAVYFDRDDDGLKNKVPMGTRVLEIELLRREKKERKPASEDMPTNLEEKMKQHKAETAKAEADKLAFLQAQQQQAAAAAAATATAGAQQDKKPGIQVTNQTNPETSNTNPALHDPEKVKALEDTMRKFGLMNPALTKVADAGITSHTVDSNTPSENGASSWSDSDKHAADDNMTAASSVYIDPKNKPQDKKGETGESYKKPYVEEDLQSPQVD